MPHSEDDFRRLRPIEVRHLIPNLAGTPHAETMHEVLARGWGWHNGGDVNSWYQALQRTSDDYQELYLRDVELAWRDAEQRFCAEPSLVYAIRQIRYAMTTWDLRDYLASLAADDLITQLQDQKIRRGSALEMALHSPSVLRDVARHLLVTADDVEQCSVVARLLEPGSWDGLGVVTALADQLAPPAVSVVLDRTAGHGDPQAEAALLTALASRLPAGHVPAVVRRVAALPEPAQRRAVLIALAPRIGRVYADQALRIDGLLADPTATLAVLERLPDPPPAAVARQLLRTIQTWPPGIERAGAVHAVSGAFQRSTRQELLDEETALVRRIAAMPARVRALYRLGGITAVVDLATTTRPERSAAAIIAAVAADLDDKGVQRALAVTDRLRDPAARARALGALIPRRDPRPSHRFDSAALQLAADPAIGPDDAATIIVGLAPRLGPSGARRALDVAAKLRTPAARGRAVIALAPVLPTSAGTTALEVVARIRPAAAKAAALAALVPVLSQARLKRALELLGTLPTEQRAEPRAALAKRMDPAKMGRLAPRPRGADGGRLAGPSWHRASRPPTRDSIASTWQWGSGWELDLAMAQGAVDLRRLPLARALGVVRPDKRHRALDLALGWANSVTTDGDAPDAALRPDEPSPFPITVGLLDRYRRRGEALRATRSLPPYRRAEALAELARIGPATKRAALARQAVRAVTEAARARSPAGVAHGFQVLADLMPLLDAAGHRDMAQALRAIDKLPDGLFDTHSFDTRLELIHVAAPDLKAELRSDHLRATARAHPSRQAAWLREVVDELPLALLDEAEQVIVTANNDEEWAEVALQIVARDHQLGGVREAGGLIGEIIEQGVAELGTGGEEKLQIAAKYAALISSAEAAALCCPGPGRGILRVVIERAEDPPEVVDTLLPLFRRAVGLAEPPEIEKLSEAAYLDMMAGLSKPREADQFRDAAHLDMLWDPRQWED
jgi:hypothetical protein